MGRDEARREDPLPAEATLQTTQRFGHGPLSGEDRGKEAPLGRGEGSRAQLSRMALSSSGCPNTYEGPTMQREIAAGGPTTALNVCMFAALVRQIY